MFDLSKDASKPYAVLTGDTLFIGDVGRPDLRASLGWSAHALGSRLYDSLRNQLLPLPDATLVYPAHGAGSLCGKQLSSDTVSTLGDQRRLNYALQPMSKEDFIQLVTADQPDAGGEAHQRREPRAAVPRFSVSGHEALLIRESSAVGALFVERAQTEHCAVAP